MNRDEIERERARTERYWNRKTGNEPPSTCFPCSNCHTLCYRKDLRGGLCIDCLWAVVQKLRGEQPKLL